MTFVLTIYNLLFNDFYTIFINVLIGFVIYKLTNFYYKVWTLPPGPIPLPYVGNTLLFKTSGDPFTLFDKLTEKYGKFFTFWFFNKPFVIITDLELGREVLRKNDFAGRPESYFGSFLSNDEHKDVIATDYGHEWEALRRVAHSAVQKYSTNDKLMYLAADCVDNTFKSIIEKEGLNKEFDPVNYIYLTFLNILANSAFGVNFSIDDEEFKHYKYSFKDFGKEEVGKRFLLWEFSTLLRFFDRKLVKKQRNLTNKTIDIMRKRFKNHLKEYNESIERDFCDALITAKNEALREGKESAPYLKDENLVMVVFDLFLAGSDTSFQTFLWILLFLCYYPEFQKKLRQEIETQIGDKIATHEDRNRCHYAMAFISETLRLRNVVGGGFPHKAVVRSKIGDYTIPEGTGVFLNHGIVLTDEKHWPNAHEFRPERFLENGKYITTRPKAYIPFSVGRRVCLGEKLAIADLFLVLTRFVQKTSDYDLTLGSNNGIDINPNIIEFVSPYEYKIIFKTKD